MVLALAGPCFGDVSHILPEYNVQATSTTPPPPRPYSFGYSAGRFPGHVDRVQSESGDGTGVIHGRNKKIFSRLHHCFGMLNKKVHESQSLRIYCTMLQKYKKIANFLYDVNRLYIHKILFFFFFDEKI